MLKEAVLHRHGSDWVYALNRLEIVFRLRTGKNDLTGASLLWMDKYRVIREKPVNQTLPLVRVASDELFDYWEVVMKPEGRSLYYLFELSDIGSRLYYGNCGFYRQLPEEFRNWYEMPYLNEQDVFTLPDWAYDAVVYQVFPERFENGDKSNDPEGVSDWYGKVSSKTMLGGDLEGVIRRMDHIEALGANTIYLTPIFESETNHKYNIVDYYRVDPHFGDLETLRRLTSEAHRRGMRIVLDAVFNHCGTGFFAFRDLLENQEKSAYREWFDVRKFPVRVKDYPNYASYSYFGSMPKLMTKNPEVAKYLLEVSKYWIREADIDGWRIDVATEVDHRFWRDFRIAVKTLKPDALIVGEIWHDAAPWLSGDQFDTTMNYPFRQAVIGFTATGEISVTRFDEVLGELRGNYKRQAWLALWNLLGSHDTERFLYLCKGNRDMAKAGVLLLMTLPGTPMIYYGDEVGMTGGPDPDCRRGMIWDEAKQDREMLAFYRDAIGLRRRYRCLRRGDFETVYCRDDVCVYGFRRSDEAGSLDVYLNAGNEPHEIRFSGSVDACDLLSGRIYSSAEGSGSITLESLKPVVIEWRKPE
jgi:glycosidase